MKKRNFRLILMTTMLFIMTTALSFADEVDVAGQNAAKFGIWTLIPPLVAISLAFITKNVIVSLVIGIMSGGFILNISGNNPFMALFYSFLWLSSTLLCACTHTHTQSAFSLSIHLLIGCFHFELLHIVLL